MRVVALDPTLEEAFWHCVLDNKFDYHLFIQDLKLEKEKTEIVLALKNEKIDGMMLIYRRRTVQLRGSLEAGEALIDRLDLEKANIMAPREHEHTILRKYKPLKKREVTRMTLQRGEERLFVKHATERLKPSDAKEIVDLLREASPDWWGEYTTEKITNGMEGGYRWIGIKRNGKIVSVGSTFLTEFGSYIGVVATHETFRNKGYATSIVSTLAKEILRRSEYVLIHVESNNAPAIRVYTEVGFKPYKNYQVIQGELME